ncbi:hypothetical protein niasHT_012212 [Heterodera trifolii]|uniref:HTH psq-type domain-containing protein n=1 Tax=Heterodera trifolii TaxID=157864 RepID=A0ABD2LFK2_9BILA
MHSSQDSVSNSYQPQQNGNNIHQSPEGTAATALPEAMAHSQQQMMAPNVAVIQNGGGIKGGEEVRKESTEEDESDDEEMDDEDVDDDDDDEEEEEEEEEESGSGEEANHRRHGTESGDTATTTPAGAGTEVPLAVHMATDVAQTQAAPGNAAAAAPPTGTELLAIRANLQILNHQMALLMRALNVAPCACAECQDAQRVQHCVALPVSNGIASQHMQHAARLGNMHSGSAASSFATPGTQQQQSLFSAGGADMSGSGAESAPRGRRSKYCTPEEKKTVASYVQCHGATAAARKFNIPPAVAAYYYRKEFKKQGGVSARRASISVHQQQQGMAGGDGTKLELGDGQGDDSGMEQIGQLWQQGNYSGGGGGGGYLRGRGRGRPKLIGDELDAELVEYIVQLKQTNPRAHITAAQALVIARKYIAEKAPGLLEENGGQVKLKITWAMKLVTRVQEREREIQLGLPAGSLQNLPLSSSALANSGLGGTDHHQQQQSSASSALVSELLGQNLIGNQQIDVNALLAAAAAENPQQIDLNDAAVLNLLGMATGGSDLFSNGGGTGNALGGGHHEQSQQQQHAGGLAQQAAGGGQSSSAAAAAAALQQQYNQRYKQEMAESDEEAIRQLLSSLHQQGGGGAPQQQQQDHVGGGAAQQQQHHHGQQHHQQQQRGARDSAGGGGAGAISATAILAQTTGTF